MPELPIEGCDLNAIKAAAACFMPQCLGETDREALEILVRYETAVAEGMPQLTLHELDAAAASWAQLSESERKAICLWIDLQNAIGEGADFGGDTSVNHLLELAKCYKCIGTARRKGIMLFLKCVNTVEEIVENAVPCWVAREVYGWDNPKWLLFAAWLMGEAPAPFRKLYLAYGRRFAAWIADKPRLKTLIRRLMDKVAI